MDQQMELLRAIRVALQNDDYATAIDSLEQVVALARERGDTGAESRHLGNLALTYYRLGQPDKALEHFQEALECARRDGDTMTQNGLLGNMGNILREVQRYEEAIDYLNEALLMAQEVGDVRGRGIWLSNLGLVYDDLQQPHQALSLHQQAVRIARQLHDQPALALRLEKLCQSYQRLDQLTNALPPCEEAYQVYRQLGRQQEAALLAEQIGDLYADRGREVLPDAPARELFASALHYYGEAMEQQHQLGNAGQEAQVIRSIGKVLADVGQYDDARQYLAVAQQMFEALGLNQQAEHSRHTLKRLIDFLEAEGEGNVDAP